MDRGLIAAMDHPMLGTTYYENDHKQSLNAMLVVYHIEQDKNVSTFDDDLHNCVRFLHPEFTSLLV